MAKRRRLLILLGVLFVIVVVCFLIAKGTSTFYDDKAYNMEKVWQAVFGGDGIRKADIVWKVGNYTEEGEETEDAQNMRLISEKIFCDSDMVVRFKNTDKYCYTYVVYDIFGNYLPGESSRADWLTEDSFTVSQGRYFALRVREVNYALWTKKTIKAFTPTVTVTTAPMKGLVQRVGEMETGKASAVPGGTGTSKSDNVSLLLQYEDHVFQDLEQGEIIWDSGLDREGADPCFVRSRDYYSVTDSDTIFVAKIPPTALWSLYRYTAGEDGYVWQDVSDWYEGSQTATLAKGSAYRLLVYDRYGIAPEDVNIIRSGSLIADMIESAVTAAGRPKVLSYPLSSDDVMEMNATLLSIQYLAKSNTAVIPFLTDLHLTCSPNPNVLDDAASVIKRQLSIYNRLAKLQDFDLCVFGGDYLDNNSKTDKYSALTTMRHMEMLLEYTEDSAPRFVLRGNHDDNMMYKDYRGGFISNQEFYSAIGKLDGNKTRRNADEIDHSYGYYDIENKKIRVFLLNTVDIPSEVDMEANTINFRGQWDTGFQQEQLQFVADHLKFSEPGWQVIFFSHHPLSNQEIAFPETTAKAASIGVSGKNGGSSMLEIITAFRDGGSGVATCDTEGFESRVAYDFTGNQSNTVIALVSGHSHMYSEEKVNGMNMICTRAVAGHPTYVADGMTSAATYFVIDRSERKLYCISCDISDAKGNPPTSPDHIISY